MWGSKYVSAKKCFLLNWTFFALFLSQQRSEEFPYTHPFGEIRSFSIAVMDGVTFVITAGGEGLIRTWRFDSAKGVFEQIMVLEGHIRAVTSVLLHGNKDIYFLHTGFEKYEP